MDMGLNHHPNPVIIAIKPNLWKNDYINKMNNYILMILLKNYIKPSIGK